MPQINYPLFLLTGTFSSIIYAYIYAQTHSHTDEYAYSPTCALSRAHPLTYSLAQILSLVLSRAISIASRDLRDFKRAHL